MSDKHIQRVNSAFSKADVAFYDSYGEDNIITWARNVVYSHIFRYISDGDKVLDMAAGTGADSLFLANRGFQVHAIDISDGMISTLKKKIKNHNLVDRISYQQLSFTKLNQIKNGPFDYVLSNFGGLNCIDPRSIRKVGENLKNILVTGSIITLVVMPPICPWEVLFFPLDKDAAFRRLPGLIGKGVDAKIEDVEFTAYYYTPNQIVNQIGNEFDKIDLQGLCIFTPPLFKDEDNFPKKYPKLFKTLKFIDSKISHISPFNSIGDFYILTLKYCP